MSRSLLSDRAGRLSFWFGVAALALLAFIRITRELIEGEVTSVDRTILLAATRARTPWFTSTAIDVTALGSVTLVALFSVLALIVLLVLRDRPGALQLFAASLGAGLLTLATKNIIERVRPEKSQRLIVVSGFSYPSGHSLVTCALYLTIAIIAGRSIRHPGARVTIFAALSAVVLLVAASRVYLGVHYATDVASGIALGAAWAFILAGLFTLFGRRASL
jgi:undecaprenyl-diphosphatase